MTIPFSTIPEYLQISIIQKLSNHDFFQFHKSSRDGVTIIEKSKTKFTVRMGTVYVKEKGDGFYFRSFAHELQPDVLLTLPIRIDATRIYVKKTLPSKLCNLVTEFLLKSNSTANNLYIGEIACSPNELEDLLKSSQAHTTVVSHPIPTNILCVMKNVSTLTATCPLSINDLLLLKCSTLYLDGTHLTNQDINAFLKDWFLDSRTIVDIVIKTTAQLHRTHIFDGIEYSVNPTPDTYEIEKYGTERLTIVIETHCVHYCDYKLSCGIELLQ